MTRPRCGLPLRYTGEPCVKAQGHGGGHKSAAAMRRERIAVRRKRGTRQSGLLFPGRALDAVPGVTPDPAADRAAALVICGQAVSADDARMLLEMCGLLPYRPGRRNGYSYGVRS